LTRAPNQYQELNKHHEAGRDRKVQEMHATVASRASTDPQEKGTGKPAIVNATNWLKRQAEASSQKLARIFGRFGELTPDETATVSNVQPVARSFARTPDSPEQKAQASQEAQSKTALTKGVTVQHSTLPGITRDDAVKSPASATREYVPSAAIRAYYALGDARRAELGQPPRWPAEIQPADNRNKDMDNALKAKGQIGKPKMPGKLEKSHGNDIGRDVDD
jgi:hypothetical protein